MPALRMYDCLPAPVVVTRTDCVPRAKTEVSLGSADAVPVPPVDQPCWAWNCWDQVARRCLGRRPDGANDGTVQPEVTRVPVMLRSPAAADATGALESFAGRLAPARAPPAVRRPPIPARRSAERRPPHAGRCWVWSAHCSKGILGIRGRREDYIFHVRVMLLAHFGRFECRDGAGQEGSVRPHQPVDLAVAPSGASEPRTSPPAARPRPSLTVSARRRTAPDRGGDAVRGARAAAGAERPRR